MKAQCRWSRPGRIEYPANWEIFPGKDSEERGRLQSRWKGEFEVKYRSPDQIPESPREAPHHAAYDPPFADPPSMIEVSTRAPPRRQPDGGQPGSAHSHQHHSQTGGGFIPPHPAGRPRPTIGGALQASQNAGVGGRRVRSERAPGAAPVGAIRRPQGSGDGRRNPATPRTAPTNRRYPRRAPFTATAERRPTTTREPASARG